MPKEITKKDIEIALIDFENHADRWGIEDFLALFADENDPEADLNPVVVRAWGLCDDMEIGSRLKTFIDDGFIL